MGNQFPLRPQTCGNQECLAGNGNPLSRDASGDPGIALNLHNGVITKQLNGKFLQSPLMSRHAAALPFLLHQRHGQTRCCQLLCHDQA